MQVVIAIGHAMTVLTPRKESKPEVIISELSSADVMPGGHATSQHPEAASGEFCHPAHFLETHEITLQLPPYGFIS